MSQYCGVPCVCSVHGAGDESDSSAVHLRASRLGRVFDFRRDRFVRALRHAAVELSIRMVQEATARQQQRAGQNERQDFAKAIHAVCLQATSAQLPGRRTVRLQYPRGIALSFDRQAKSARLVFSLRLIHTLQTTHFHNHAFLGENCRQYSCRGASEHRLPLSLLERCPKRPFSRRFRDAGYTEMMSAPLPTSGAPLELQTWQELEEVFARLGQLARSPVAPQEFYRTVLDQSVRALSAEGGAVWLARPAARCSSRFKLAERPARLRDEQSPARPSIAALARCDGRTGRQHQSAIRFRSFGCVEPDRPCDRVRTGEIAVDESPNASGRKSESRRYARDH